MMVHGLTSALASSQPTQYNRSRWTGIDVAVDDLSMFDAAHRLLSTTMCRICALHLSGAAARFHLGFSKSLAVYGPSMAVAIEDIHEEAEGEAGDEEADMVDGNVAPAAGQGEAYNRQ